MKLSLQLYTLRDAMAADLDGTLSAVRAMGLEYVELAGLYGKSAADFASILASHKLTISGSHVGIEALEQDFAGVVAENRALGNSWIIIPYISDTRRNWSEVAGSLTALGKRLMDEGMKLAYHNHDFELGPEEGLRQLIEGTDPACVWFQVDLGWVQFAGKDPAVLLRQLGERAPLVHLKDMLTGAENPHVVAGDGSVDWPEVLSACTSVEFGAIEMDLPPHDPVEDVRVCVEFFRSRI